MIRDDPGWWVPDLPASPDENAWHPLDALFAQLTSPSGEWLGVLSVDLPAGGRRPGPVQLEVLELLADQAAIAITHARLHDALQHQESAVRCAALHDPLTGLANRILVAERGQRLAEPTQPAEPAQPAEDSAPGGAASDTAAAGDDAALLLIDLDGFKRINDLHGHEAGDELLRVVADRLRRYARTDDLVAAPAATSSSCCSTARTPARPPDCSPPGSGGPEPARPRTRRRTARRCQHRHGRTARPVPLPELLAQADRAMYGDKHRRQRRATNRPAPN